MYARHNGRVDLAEKNAELLAGFANRVRLHVAGQQASAFVPMVSALPMAQQPVMPVHPSRSAIGAAVSAGLQDCLKGIL